MLTNVSFSVLTDYTKRRANGIRAELQEPEFELSGWISVNFWSRKIEFSFSQQGIPVIRVQVNQVKITEMWGEIQRKSDLVQVSREFELSEFKISGLYSIKKTQYLQHTNQVYSKRAEMECQSQP